MSELTLLVLRIGFLALLWLFVLWVVYSLRSDLFGSPARKMKTPGNAAVNPVVDAAPESPSNSSDASEPEVKTDALPSAAAEPTEPTAGNGAEQQNAGAPTKLVILNGIAAGSTIQLDEDVVTVGRSPDSTLVIVDEYTSTYHARLDRKGSNWIITDLDSTNGTKVAGSKLKAPMVLTPGTVVTIGTTSFELRP